MPVWCFILLNYLEITNLKNTVDFCDITWEVEEKDEIFRLVSHFPRFNSCSIAEKWLRLGQCSQRRFSRVRVCGCPWSWRTKIVSQKFRTHLRKTNFWISSCFFEKENFWIFFSLSQISAKENVQLFVSPPVWFPPPPSPSQSLLCDGGERSVLVCAPTVLCARQP